MISKEYTFKLSEAQYEKLEKWFYGFHKMDEFRGPIRGELTFEITPTSIGNFVTAKADGKELDLSEI